MENGTEPLFAPTSYERIKKYSQNLKDYIAKNGRPFGLDQFPYEIKMDFDTSTGDGKGLGRLKKLLASNRLLCVLGLGDNAEGKLEFKVSLLGLDDKGNVDPRHKLVAGDKDFPVDGEETWPPGDTITDPAIDLP